MFADCDTVDPEIMIYRSSKLFEHVYAYLLDDKYPYPIKYHSELDYYLVNYNILSLFNSNIQTITLMQINHEEIKRKVADIFVMLDGNHENIKRDIADICDKSKHGNQTIELDTKCPVSYCDKKCMLPVCEDHRGTCCYYGYLKMDGPIASWDHEKCDNIVWDHEIYCTLHKYDH
jgi:hypothetical protein